MALGLLMCGRDALPFKKVEVDLAFSGAWRRWAYRDRFPRVSTDLGKGLDAYVAMTRADEHKNVLNLYWESSGRELAIRARARWADERIDPHVVADSIDGDVPAEGWRELAAEFLQRFER